MWDSPFLLFVLVEKSSQPLPVKSDTFSCHSGNIYSKSFWKLPKKFFITSVNRNRRQIESKPGTATSRSILLGILRLNDDSTAPSWVAPTVEPLKRKTSKVRRFVVVFYRSLNFILYFHFESFSFHFPHKPKRSPSSNPTFRFSTHYRDSNL